MAKFYKKHRVFIFTFVIALLAIVFTIKLSSTSPFLSGSSLAETVFPIPTLVPIKEATSKSEVHSPDGTMKAVLTKTFNSQTLVNYTVSVFEISGSNEKIISSMTLGENQIMQIPDNSWSPDNKYMFLKENDSGKLSFYVFKTSGETFSDGRDYIDVVPLFEDKKYESKLSDITGWDSNNLLHIFTISGNGTKGPSFWFDVEGKNFYILGNR